MVKLEFEVEPIAKGRPRFTRFGHTYTPEKTKTFEDALQAIAHTQFKGQILKGPLHVMIDFHMRRPKTVKREHHVVKPDLDNLQKAVLDSLNKIVWIDDSQVVCLTGRKFYSENPKIIVNITKVGGDNGIT